MEGSQQQEQPKGKKKRMKFTASWDELSRIIVRPDGWDRVFSHFRDDAETAPIRERLTAKEYRMNDTSQTYRVINHWSSIGLVDDDRKESEKMNWRMFSYTELVWIQVVAELRKFGCSLEFIKKVKGKLMDSAYGRNVFMFYIAYAGFKNEPSYIVVFSTGDAEAATREEVTHTEQISSFVDKKMQPYILSMDSHIKLNLNRILQRLSPDPKKLKPVYKYATELSDAEKQLLFSIRMDDCDSITVKLKNGQIETIDATKYEDVKERVTDLLKRGDFQEITIKQRHGKVQSLKRTSSKTMQTESPREAPARLQDRSTTGSPSLDQSNVNANDRDMQRPS